MKKPCTTEEIIKALDDRDPSALKEIEKNYGGLMRSMAYNLGMEPRDAEECMNDAYMEVWNTVPPAKPENIRSYVCMLMRRIIIDRIRYNSAEKRAGAVFSEISNELDACADVENKVIDEICIPSIINKFLKDQTPENREIFIRRYFEFESNKSISRDLMLTTSAVDKRLSRMRSELKKLFTQWGYDQ